MQRLVKTSEKLGNRWTIIVCDQALYELATAIRMKEPQNFSNVILLLGGFHQAHNFLKATLKIMRNSGGEELLCHSGLCQEGTANKIFGEKADYYQSLHALQIIAEAMWQLFWKAFINWLQENELHIDDTAMATAMELGKSVQPYTMQELLEVDLGNIEELIEQFRETLQVQPTANYWLAFLDMARIFLRFLFYQRQGNWLGYLSESAKMLPFFTAAGHYKRSGNRWNCV